MGQIKGWAENFSTRPVVIYIAPPSRIAAVITCY